MRMKPIHESSPSTQPGGRDWPSLRIVAVLICLFAFGDFMWSLLHFASPIPVSDDFYAWLEPALQFKSGDYNLIGLCFSRHMEHRYYTWRPIFFSMLALTGEVRLDWMIVLAGLSLPLTVTGFYILFRKRLRASRPGPGLPDLIYFAPVALIAINYLYGHIFFWASGAVMHLPTVAFALGAIAALNSRRAWGLAIAAISTALALGTGVQGLAMIPAVLCFLALQGRHKELLLYAALLLVLSACYLSGSNIPAMAERAGSESHLGGRLLFLLYNLGYLPGGIVDHGQLAGIRAGLLPYEPLSGPNWLPVVSGLAASGLLAYLAWRRAWSGLPVLFVLALFCLTALALTTFGRYNPETGPYLFIARYSPYSMFLWICLYLMFVLRASRDQSRSRGRLWPVFLVLFFAALVSYGHKMELSAMRAYAQDGFRRWEAGDLGGLSNLDVDHIRGDDILKRSIASGILDPARLRE